MHNFGISRPTERTPIRLGRTRTGGLLEALIYVGIVMAVIALVVLFGQSR